MSQKNEEMAEVKEALNNIRASLRIQALGYGNENAAWILRHL